MAQDRSQRPLVLITGSSGLIGSRIQTALEDAYTVVGIDRDPPKEGDRARFVECDLTDDRSTQAALERVAQAFGPRVASVIHLAAYYDFSGEPSPLYDALTVEGTRRLLRGLRRLQVEQVVFSSSLLVMRPVEDEDARVDETSPVEALWDYPRSKLEAERVIAEEKGDAKAVVLRIAGVYDEDGHSLPIAQQLRRIYERKLESFFFPGDARHGQPFVHLDDLVRCFRAVVDRRAELGDHEVFLIGEEDLVSYAEIQDVAGEVLHGREWPTLRIPAPIAKAGAWVKSKTGSEDFIKPWMIDLADAHLPIDASRARERLGWEPRRHLRDVLPEIAARLREDPARWYAIQGIEPPEDVGAARESGEASR